MHTQNFCFLLLFLSYIDVELDWKMKIKGFTCVAQNRTYCFAFWNILIVFWAEIYLQNVSKQWRPERENILVEQTHITILLWLLICYQIYRILAKNRITYEGNIESVVIYFLAWSYPYKFADIKILFSTGFHFFSGYCKYTNSLLDKASTITAIQQWRNSFRDFIADHSSTLEFFSYSCVVLF